MAGIPEEHLVWVAVPGSPEVCLLPGDTSNWFVQLLFAIYFHQPMYFWAVSACGTHQVLHGAFLRDLLDVEMRVSCHAHPSLLRGLSTWQSGMMDHHMSMTLHVLRCHGDEEGTPWWYVHALPQSIHLLIHPWMSHTWARCALSPSNSCLSLQSVSLEDSTPSSAWHRHPCMLHTTYLLIPTRYIDLLLCFVK